jgi:chitinase
VPLTRTALTLTAGLALGVAGLAAAPAAQAAAQPHSAGNLVSAPYFMPLDDTPQSISDITANSGAKDLIMSFVLAPDSGGCTPTWDGNAAQPVSSDTTVLADVQAVRAAGGDVGVSFGGYNGTELAAACGDASSLAAAYQSVITKYSLKYVDFDIEGDDLGNDDAETMRFQAINTLKAEDPGLVVSLTLPATTVGLSGLDTDEINLAEQAGADIDLYTMMDFDYGGTGTAADVQNVAEDFHQQLVSLTGDDDATAYAHSGLILMNGHTDQPSELYTVDTFSSLVAYAQSHHLGRLSYWALNRDRACTGNVGWVEGYCSSVDQQPYDFTKILGQYTG